MLEKTIRFLKKEYGKRAEPNDDYCYTLWEEVDLALLQLTRLACGLASRLDERITDGKGKARADRESRT